MLSVLSTKPLPQRSLQCTQSWCWAAWDSKLKNVSWYNRAQNTFFCSFNWLPPSFTAIHISSKKRTSDNQTFLTMWIRRAKLERAQINCINNLKLLFIFMIISFGVVSFGMLLINENNRRCRLSSSNILQRRYAVDVCFVFDRKRTSSPTLNGWWKHFGMMLGTMRDAAHLCLINSNAT